MVATLQTRKPITAIQTEDLDAFPMWEFCLDEEGVEEMDETWIRPVNAAEIPKGAYALTVAVRVVTANGTELKGFIAIDTAGAFEVSGLGVSSPQYCFIPIAVTAADKAAFCAIVSVAPEVAFPIRYQLCVALEGEAMLREGQIG
ncbi:MAG: hypothetical protein IV086_06075 [Hyphomonadaceae bacterium]|nr:MAG: hypothetical protein FD160_3394 [Caulobacteraceae bacterium]MBT9445247.1 hypothetical protein [Hyphomonadaceae bacterium]